MKLFAFLAFYLNFYQTFATVQLAFYGRNVTDVVSFTTSDASNFGSLAKVYYDKSKTTMIYVHGWFGLATFRSRIVRHFHPIVDTASSEMLIGGFLKRKAAYNVAALDWTDDSMDENILAVIFRIKNAIRDFTAILRKMQTNGLVIEKIHAIGYSFGAVFVANVGDTFRSSGTPFQRVTGLDPGNFYGGLDFFLELLNIKKITKTDAKFVDVIHTSQYSDSDANGHANFWPNSGGPQPGYRFEDYREKLNISMMIIVFGGSHGRAYQFFAETIHRNSSVPPFVSIECSEGRKVVNKSTCSGPRKTSMGLFAKQEGSTDEEIHYFVETNALSPFSKT